MTEGYRQAEEAFRVASAAIDEAWVHLRALYASEGSRRVDTLSDSLADPFGPQIEVTLSNARFAIQSEADRTAMISVARACEARGLLTPAAADRLVKEYANDAQRP